MTVATNFRLYRGFEIYALVYPHRPAKPGSAHNYDEGFDAAVRISEPQLDAAEARSRVFRLMSNRPFLSAGDARRASTIYAEHLIDACPPGKTLWDAQ
jgi:hypothetical protein